MPFDGPMPSESGTPPTPPRPKRIWYSLEYERQVRKRKVYEVEVIRNGECHPFLSIIADCKADAAPTAHDAVSALHGD